MTRQTYYQVLGIGEDATSEDVAAARRTMIKAVHPDLATDETDRLERERLARTVNDMCDTLLDPLRRYDYDTALDRARRWGASHPDDGDTDAWYRGDAVGDEMAAAHSENDVVDQHGMEAGPLDWIERRVTWPVAALGLLLLVVSAVIYDRIGGRVLDRIGLHVGRFGSAAVVLLMALALLLLCLGVLRAVRRRS